MRVQAALTWPEETQGPYLGTLPLTFYHAHALQSKVPAESQSPTLVGSQIRHAQGLCDPLPLSSLDPAWLSQNVTCPWKGPMGSEDQQLQAL